MAHVEGIRQLVIRHSRSSESLSKFWVSFLWRTRVVMLSTRLCTEVKVVAAGRRLLDFVEGRSATVIRLYDR